MSSSSIFQCPERLVANAFANGVNDQLAQARAILSLNHKTPATIEAAANIIGVVMADLTFGCCDRLEDDDVSATRYLLNQAKSVLDVLSNDSNATDDTIELVCDAAFDFTGRAMDFISTLCS